MSLSTARAAEKQEVARKTTFTSIALNCVLMSAQVIVGVFAHSQALIADGVHSLADLVSDFVVLLANKQSAAAPDDDHNYGHSRYETVASLFLGALLITVGIGMLWRAGERMTNLDGIPEVHASALAVAVIVLVISIIGDVVHYQEMNKGNGPVIYSCFVEVFDQHVYFKQFI